MRPRHALGYLSLATAFTIVSGCSGKQQTKGGNDKTPQLHSLVINEVNNDTTSQPLSAIPPKRRLAAGGDDGGPGKIPIPQGLSQASSSDPVVQRALVKSTMPLSSRSFEGIGQGFSGPAGTFTVSSAPPDPNGAANALLTS